MEKINFNLDQMNFDSLVKKSEKRKSIYKYPDELLQSADYKNEMKKLRKQLRNDSLKICLTVFNAYKSKDKASIEAAKKEFTAFYKKNFVVNDYSFESFSQVSVKENKEQHDLYAIVLQLMREKEEITTEVKKEKEKK
jgi:hypothetical protein